MSCDACGQPFTELGMIVATQRGDARICMACKGLPFAMVWRMLGRRPVYGAEREDM
jgi:hypothetical protein